MPTRNGTHLTDEQFTGLLLGTISPFVSAHLDACPQCAEEAQRVSGAIGSFEQQSRLWAERRVTVSQPELVSTLVSRRPAVVAWYHRPSAWSAVAATLVLAAFIGVTAHVERPNESLQPVQLADQQAASQTAANQTAAIQTAAVQNTANGSSATLKADNDLLSAIHGELTADATPATSLYGLTVEAQAAPSRSLKRVSN
jgi:hypothetical protein